MACSASRGCPAPPRPLAARRTTSSAPLHRCSASLGRCDEHADFNIARHIVSVHKNREQVGTVPPARAGWFVCSCVCLFVGLFVRACVCLLVCFFVRVFALRAFRPPTGVRGGLLCRAAPPIHPVPKPARPAPDGSSGACAFARFSITGRRSAQATAESSGASPAQTNTRTQSEPPAEPVRACAGTRGR